MNLDDSLSVREEDICPLCCESWSNERYEYPCPCKYQVCTFCYEKIMKGDKKCPNCRELYDPAKKVVVEPPKKAAQKRDRPTLNSPLRDEYERLFGEAWDTQFVTSLDHPLPIPPRYLGPKGELLPATKKDPYYQYYEGPIEGADEKELQNENSNGQRRFLRPMFLTTDGLHRFQPYAFKYPRRRTVRNFPKEDLKSVCILLWNLVYCVGVPVNLKREQLVGPNFFGKYGKVKEIIFGNDTRLNDQSQIVTRTIYVTYESAEQAFLCIQSLNHTFIGGSNLKAKFAKTRFCKIFLEKGRCESIDCKYLHSYENLSPDQLFLKEEVGTRYFLDRAETRIPNELMELRETFETNKNQLNEFPPPITRAVELYIHRKERNCYGCAECKPLMSMRCLAQLQNGQGMCQPYQRYGYRANQADLNNQMISNSTSLLPSGMSKPKTVPGGYDTKISNSVQLPYINSLNKHDSLTGRSSNISTTESSDISRSNSTSIRTTTSDEEKSLRKKQELLKLEKEKEELEKMIEASKQAKKEEEKKKKKQEEEKRNKLIKEIREENQQKLEKFCVDKAKKKYMYDMFGDIFQVSSDIVGASIIESVLGVFDVNVEQKCQFTNYNDFENKYSSTNKNNKTTQSATVVDVPKSLSLEEKETLNMISNYIQSENLHDKIGNTLAISDESICGVFIPPSGNGSSILDDTSINQDEKKSNNNKSKKAAKINGQTNNTSEKNTELNEAISKILHTSSFILGYSDFIPLPSFDSNNNNK